MSQFTSNNDLFEYNILQFDTNNGINIEEIPISIPSPKFGIVNLKAVSSPAQENEFDFIFMVDCSGSMSHDCSDGKNKIEHIIHTIKNIVLYFKSNTFIKVHITIDAFNNYVERILERSSINEDNYMSMIEKIDKLIPNHNTDIELALNSIKDTTQIIKSQFPNNNIVVIFMTDGKINCGSSEHSILSTIVDTTITNVFVGFGIDHDSHLLNTLGNLENSSYYFIDKLENSGLVYGEILHGNIYNLISDVVISIKNGLVYDFKNNIWVEILYLGKICSEANKIYHIASSNPDDCIVTLSASKNANVNVNFNVNITITKTEEYTDLTKYIYRQRTLQHLYIACNFIKTKNIDNNFNIGLRFRFDDYEYNSEMLQEESVIQKNLRKFIKEMKYYMKENNIEDDKFMINLCDDICICYRTFKSKFAAMYSYSRHSSQGTQRCYTVTNTPEVTLDLYSNPKFSRIKPPKLIRQTNQLGSQIYDLDTLEGYNVDNDTENLFDYDDDLQHIVAHCGDTPYLTPTATLIMRDISSGTNRNSCDIFSQFNY